MRLIALLPLLVLSGCFTRTVYIRSEVPVYDLPTRPTLNLDVVETENEVALRGYAAKLEWIIRQHNEWAAKNNTPVVGR